MAGIYFILIINYIQHTERLLLFTSFFISFFYSSDITHFFAGFRTICFYFLLDRDRFLLILRRKKNDYLLTVVPKTALKNSAANVQYRYV